MVVIKVKNAKNTYKTPSFDFTQVVTFLCVFAHPMAKITYHLWIASNLLEFLSWILPQNQENLGEKMAMEAHSQVLQNGVVGERKNQMQLHLIL